MIITRDMLVKAGLCQSLLERFDMHKQDEIELHEMNHFSIDDVLLVVQAFADEEKAKEIHVKTAIYAAEAPLPLIFAGVRSRFKASIEAAHRMIYHGEIAGRDYVSDVSEALDMSRDSLKSGDGLSIECEEVICDIIETVFSNKNSCAICFDILKPIKYTVYLAAYVAGDHADDRIRERLNDLVRELEPKAKSKTFFQKIIDYIAN